MTGINIANNNEAIQPRTIRGYKGEQIYKGISFFIQKVRHGYRAYNYNGDSSIMTNDYHSPKEAIREAMTLIDNYNLTLNQ